MIKVINLNKTKPEEIRVLNYQIDLSDVDIADEVTLNFIRDPKKVEKQINEAIDVASQSNVDLLCFPELSVPSNSLKALVEFSKNSNTVIVGGSQYFEDNRKIYNRSPIIINGDISFTYKNNPSILEKSPVKFGNNYLTPGNEILFFNNSSIGNFIVVICADYLDVETRNQILGQNPDLVIVIALQTDSSKYFMNFQADCHDSKDGIYFIYSNVYHEKYSDGRSSLFGHMDKIFRKHFQRQNISDLNPETKLISLPIRSGYFIADINLKHKKVLLPHSVSDEPNVNLIEWSIDLKNERDDFLKYISSNDEKYKFIKDLFVQPNEYDEIIESIDKNNIVFIIGDPGIGKTYTSISILNHYFKKGNSVSWIKGVSREERENQISTLSEFLPEDNSVTYFEDPFGKVKFESREDIVNLFDPLIDRIKQKDAKIIITSRKEIFEQFKNENLVTNHLDNFIQELNIVKPSYDVVKLIEIFTKLINLKSNWKHKEDCVEKVIDAIKQGKLISPLGIRDLVYSSLNINSCGELDELIRKRTDESIRVFANDIVNSPISSKAFLIVTYLLEYRNINILSDVFENVMHNINALSDRDYLVSFKQLLRNQDGFRIEKVTNMSKGIRFSHPNYQEAIAILIETNNQFKFILDKTVDSLINLDFPLIANSIQRHTQKNQNISILILTKIVERALIYPISYQNKLVLSNVILKSYIKTKNMKFIDLLDQIYSSKSELKSLFDVKDATDIQQSLQFYYNYLNFHPRKHIDSSLLENEINNFINIFHSSNQYANVIAALELIKLFDLSMLNEILDSKFGKKIINELYKIDLNHRDKLKILFNDSINYDDFKKNLKETASFVKQHWNSLLKGFDEKNYISVDNGAKLAMQRGYNLLPAGIKKITGTFYEDDKVIIKDLNGELLGSGIVSYNSNELEAIKGSHTSLIYDILGYHKGINVISKNKMFLEMKR